MRYRTKLYISLVGVAFASILVGLVIFSTESEKFFIDMLRSQCLSIAATATANIDPQVFAVANLAKGETDPAYIQARTALRKMLRANQRGDIYVSNIYTIYPDPSDPSALLYGVQAIAEAPAPGTVYLFSDRQGILDNLNDFYVDTSFVTDQYGVWLSAYAPIVSQGGQYIATLGININASIVHDRLQQLIKFAIWGLASSLLLSIIIAHYLSKRVSSSLNYLCGIVTQIGEGKLEIRSELKTSDEFGILSDKINEMTRGLVERERLKMSFAKYVSQHVLERILKEETHLHLEGERKKVTVLFSDIRQFTQLAEKLPPEEVVTLLNEYFEVMIEVVFSYAGTLDKFIGDGLMAEFGAPLDDSAQEVHAIEAAIEMQRSLHRLCKKWAAEGKPLIEMGVGLHTGVAILGNIGSDRRIEYTAIGDTVNVASRLEQATKILGCSILLSETTYLGAKDKFPFKSLGSLSLPGRKEQISVYTIDLEKIPD